MEYTINLENMEGETAEGHYRASVIYRFTISSGSATTHGDISLTEAGIGEPMPGKTEQGLETPQSVSMGRVS
jgi:hypothetical protein